MIVIPRHVQGTALLVEHEDGVASGFQPFLFQLVFLLLCLHLPFIRFDFCVLEAEPEARQLQGVDEDAAHVDEGVELLEPSALAMAWLFRLALQLSKFAAQLARKVDLQALQTSAMRA